MVDNFDDLLKASNEEFKDLRLRLRNLPSHTAPAQLIHTLHRRHIGVSWKEKIVGLFRGPQMWRPVSALAVIILLAGVWITRWELTEKDLLDVEPLLTAHARYQSESMIPSSDLAGSGFGFQLASYYGEDD